MLFQEIFQAFQEMLVIVTGVSVSWVELRICKGALYLKHILFWNLNSNKLLTVVYLGCLKKMYCLHMPPCSFRVEVEKKIKKEKKKRPWATKVEFNTLAVCIVSFEISHGEMSSIIIDCLPELHCDKSFSMSAGNIACWIPGELFGGTWNKDIGVQKLFLTHLNLVVLCSLLFFDKIGLDGLYKMKLWFSSLLCVLYSVLSSHRYNNRDS